MWQPELYPEFAAKAKQGDKLLTEVNSHPAQRVVTIDICNAGLGVVLSEYWFHWDFFFEVNHPIKFIDPDDKEKV